MAPRSHRIPADIAPIQNSKFKIPPSHRIPAICPNFGFLLSQFSPRFPFNPTPGRAALPRSHRIRAPQRRRFALITKPGGGKYPKIQGLAVVCFALITKPGGVNIQKFKVWRLFALP